MNHPDVPMLFSNATNWQGKPFMKLVDYLSLAQNTPNFKDLATEIAEETYEFADFEELDEEKLAEVNRFIAEKELELLFDF